MRHGLAVIKFGLETSDFFLQQFDFAIVGGFHLLVFYVQFFDSAWIYRPSRDSTPDCAILLALQYRTSFPHFPALDSVAHTPDG